MASKTNSEHREPVAATPPAEAVPKKRIDAPHMPREVDHLEAEPILEEEEPLALEVPAAMVQQLRTQAEQLRAHLQTQQRDLDRREAQVNASLAELERGANAARLWLSERHAELDELSERLADTQRELDQRRTLLEAAESEQQRSREAWETQVAEREGRLLEAQHALAAQQATLETSRNFLGRQAAELEATQQDLVVREQAIDASEQALSTALADLEAMRAEVTSQRKRADQQLQEAQRAWNHRQETQRQQLEQREQALGARLEALELRESATEQMKANVLALHRDALEMRLASEELWAKCSGVAPTPALAQTLAGIRARLSEQFRLAGDEIAQQRQQLESLSLKLAAQHEHFQQQKRAWQQWSEGQRDEILREAENLVVQRSQLEHERSLHRDHEQAWENERQNYERRIRQLNTQMRRTHAHAA